MKQLVELQQHAEDFEKLDARVLFVFREESEGIDGLKKIREKHPTPYLMGLDLNKKRSAGYSPGDGTFHNYVIDSSGVVRGIVDGTLRDRATAEELLRILRKVDGGEETQTDN